MHREPILDQADLEFFPATVVSLMRRGRDLIWVMAGRTESNVAKLRRILAHAGSKESYICDKLLSETFHLCYNANQLA